MKQDNGLAVSVSDGPLAAASSAAVGPALRALRQAKGLSLDEVSTRLKFSVRQISALEEERWDDLPRGISLRGLVRNYARLLGADPQALIGALEPYVSSRGAARLAGSIGHAHRPERVELVRRGAGRLPRIWLILAVLAIVVGLALWQGWLPAAWSSSSFDGVNPSTGA